MSRQRPGTSLAPDRERPVRAIPARSPASSRHGGSVNAALRTRTADVFGWRLRPDQESVIDAVLDGPSNWVILGGGAIFIIGTLLFGASMVRTGVHPRLAAVGYTITLILLALLGNLPDSLLSSANHIVACVSLVWLSVSVWPGEGGGGLR